MDSIFTYIIKFNKQDESSYFLKSMTVFRTFGYSSSSWDSYQSYVLLQNPVESSVSDWDLGIRS